MTGDAQATRRSALAALLALAVLLALAACGSDQDLERESLAHSERSANDAREWLDQIARAHARADEALAAGQREQARTFLSAALDRPLPPELASEHARVLRQDLWYRLSSIGVELEPSQALREAERGLALGRHADLFSANLLVARGRALQALGRDTEAASSYHEALQLDERLLNAVLGAGPGSHPDGGP